MKIKHWSIGEYVLFAIGIAVSLPFIWLLRWWLNKDNPTLKMPSKMRPRSRDFSSDQKYIEYWLRVTGLGEYPVSSATLHVMSWLNANSYSFWSARESPDYGLVYYLFQGAEGRTFYAALARFLEQFPYPYEKLAGETSKPVSSMYYDIISKESHLNQRIVDTRNALSLIYCSILCTKAYSGQWDDTDYGRIGYRLMKLFMQSETPAMKQFHWGGRVARKAVYTQRCLDNILNAAKLPTLQSIIEPVVSGVSAMDTNVPVFPRGCFPGISSSFAISVMTVYVISEP